VKWTEAFEDYLHRNIGSRHIPLAYVVRTTATVPPPPTLQAGQPFSTEHGSVEEELTARASHTHPLYQDDNAEVYYKIEEATRGMSYAASIKPFQRRKDGRGAYDAMLTQYAGEDKWRALIKEAEDLLHNRKWKGQQSNYSLEKFIGQHRAAFVNLSQCETHVAYQLPNEISRVTYLLTGIECMSAPLQAAMALVCNDTGPNGKMNDFKSTASFLLPHDPVSTRRAATKRGTEVSEVVIDSSDEPTPKKARAGKTGVEFRFHTGREYHQLSDEQKTELNDHRDAREAKGLSRTLPKGNSHGGGGRNCHNSKSNQSNKDKKKFKSMVAAAIAQAKVDTTKKAANVASVDADFQAYVASLVLAANSPKATPKKTTVAATEATASSSTTTEDDKPAAMNLVSILGRIKK
jgi:hypothetical protein